MSSLVPSVHDLNIDQRDLEGLRKFVQETQNEAVPVPEAVFVSQILPKFLSEDPADHDIRVWKRFAGSPFVPLDVLGNDGTVLFRCPPPLKMPPTAPSGSLSTSVNEMVHTAALHAKRLPILGHWYLESKFDEMYQREQDPLERLRIWNGIITRYGYPPIGGERFLPKPEELKAIGASETSAPVVEEDVIEFDDEDQEL